MSSKEEESKLATSATTEDEDDGEENDTSLSGGLQGLEKSMRVVRGRGKDNILS